MKKSFLMILFIVIGTFIYGNDNYKEIHKEIRMKALKEIKDYGSREREIELQFGAYKKINKLINENLEAKKLYEVVSKNYPEEYTLQYKTLKEKLNELELYKKINNQNNLEKNQKSQIIIDKIIKEDKIPKKIMTEILKNGKKAYGNDYINMEKYMKASIENYFYIMKSIEKNNKE